MGEKVLVTGASGLLGHKLVLELLSKGYHVIAVYNRTAIPITHTNLRKIKLDISNALNLEDLILKTKPETIIHAAAYTDVDGCEVNKEYAWKVNVDATRSVVRAAKIIKSYLIYVSTDYVFDGDKGYYTEEDLPNPINFYGLTKLIAEEHVKASDLLYLVIRPSAIYGTGPGKLNFATFVANRLSEGREVKALVDQFVSPTLNTLLARTIVEAVELKTIGVFHVAGERRSRYDFAIEVAEALNLPKELIKKSTMNEMRWKARRPKDSSLNTVKARKTFKTKFFDNKFALKIFAEEYKSRVR